MHISGTGKRLRIYIGESDQWQGRALYAALLETLKREGLAGATVTRGVAGFGAHSRIHSASIEVLSTDLPLVVEVVDRPEQIDKALAVVGPMVREGLITVEEVSVVKYSHRYLQPLPGDRPVKEVMTREVVSVRLETLLADVVDLLIGKLFKAVPVVDAQGKVLGIISDGDLLERGGTAGRLAVAEQLDEATLAAQLAELRRMGKTAAEVMTREVVTVREDTALVHAAQLMADRNLKRLPVVDAAARLVGILSRVDVLRTVAEPRPSRPGTRPLASAGHTVADVMETDVPSVKEDADLVEIVNVMVGTEVKRVVVLDEAGRTVGVITDGDLVARVRPEARAGLLAAFTRRSKPPQEAVLARDVMSPSVLKGPPETPIPEAVRQMLAQKRKRFYVVDAESKPLGIVDRQTLLRAVAGLAVPPETPSA
jgi:CBS-domain-containing membrane protein